MKKLKFAPLALVLFSLLFMTSCFRKYNYDDDWLPDCERFHTGSLCLDNDTNKPIKVEIGDTETTVESNSVICMDLYEGQYEYVGKRGLRRQRGEVYIDACTDNLIEFD